MKVDAYEMLICQLLFIYYLRFQKLSGYRKEIELVRKTNQTS